ncbi:PhzF family phenazine biosynthesis protein [Allostreptomyces psammosilenae]|uniref:PhzF family phenazine biosynthesis protein n=1 Tax=Allostreptomyces psammosilenae TaxID=1892865 RepID=A0A852ZR63_9ACTN|nr:PhzF family phenazine biosynthesis protein [Allostreptomyces psammosilenae]NYI04869.1 PhzF family phenazine biosynthesis protein [Allostreptomyces psammosilenae]
MSTPATSPTATRIRVVDAFTDRPFAGNPAAVVILDGPVAEDWMRGVAAEMNLSETAFAHPVDQDDADWSLRWFTPAVEVNLCGHATVATAHALAEDGHAGPFRFTTRGGLLGAEVAADGAVTLDFPARPTTDTPVPPGLAAALGAQPLRTARGGDDDLLVEVADEATVRALRPDITALAALGGRGVIVTAAADEGGPYHFVSRFFAPNVGVAEDPVTGSAHTALAPYWAQRLGTRRLTAYQASARGGRLELELRGDRVAITGRAVTVLDAVLRGAAAAPSA